MVTFPIVKPAQRAVLGIAIAFAILPVIAVCLRLLARKVAGRKLDISDYLIMVACVMAVALEGVSITGVLHGGIGYDHVVPIVGQYGLEPITLLLKLLIPLQILWVLGLTFSKISILSLYMRVFALPSVKWIALGCMTVIIGWAIGTILAGFLICQPFAMNWDQTIKGHCGNQVASFQGTGVINLLTDVVVLLLPMPYLYRLNMALYKRLVLIAVFSVGFLACVVSAYRIAVLSTMDFADITYSLPLSNIFSGLEPSLAVILACVPLLRPLLGRAGGDSNGGSTPFEQSRTSHRKKLSHNQFDPLDDDSSHIRLDPMDTKHRTEISTYGRDQDGKYASDVDSMEHGEKRSGQSGRGASGFNGINVQREWKVSNGRK